VDAAEPGRKSSHRALALSPSLEYDFGPEEIAMKRTALFLLVMLSCGALALTAQEKKDAMQHNEFSTVLPNPAFDKIKSLAGDWVGTYGGKQGKMTYRVMSAGSSVILIQDGDKPGNEMVTVFAPDGKNLLATHYCSAKNHPRMKLEPGSDPTVLRFTFLDATNLSDPQIGHMVGLIVRIADANHHSQEWIFSDHGKEMTEKFEYHRPM
jgi:hypothetical protein